MKRDYGTPLARAWKSCITLHPYWLPTVRSRARVESRLVLKHTNELAVMWDQTSGRSKQPANLTPALATCDKPSDSVSWNEDKGRRERYQLSFPVIMLNRRPLELAFWNAGGGPRPSSSSIEDGVFEFPYAFFSRLPPDWAPPSPARRLGVPVIDWS